jgi:hypothetical protein
MWSKGYSAFWVAGDGNCFFATLQILINNGYDYPSIRQDIVEYLTANKSQAWVKEAFSEGDEADEVGRKAKQFLSKNCV